MEMRLGLSYTVDVEMNQELTDEDRRAMERAFDFWSAKPKGKWSVPVATLRTIFEGKPSTSTKISKEMALADNWEEEFVLLTPEEMAEIDREEKFGVCIGTCIFISTATPKKYRSLGVLNLAAHLRARGDSPLAHFLLDRGIDASAARHYTASLVDVLGARHLFANDPAQLREFLVWRKSVERTDFFRNEVVDVLLNRKLEASRRGRTLHPTERGGYSRRSYMLVATAEALFTRSEADRIVRSMGVSKSDMIVSRLKSEASFDLNVMIETIDEILSQIRNLKSTARNKTSAQRRVLLNRAQSVQAYLLSHDVAGDFNITVNTVSSNAFLLRPNAAASLQALKDRLIYLGRQALVKVVPSKVDLKSLQNLVLAGPPKFEPLAELRRALPSSETEGAAALVETESIRDSLQRRLAEADALLVRYDQAVASLGAIGAAESVPGALMAERTAILDRIELIRKQLGELDQYETMLTNLATLRAQLGTVLGVVEIQ